MDLSKYLHQIVLSGFGEEGQERISNSKVLVAGVGGLGCVTASLLVRAGVGHVVLVDRDIVEKTNLHRQILYVEGDIEVTPKVKIAEKRLLEANSYCKIEGIVVDIDRSNIEKLMEGVDLVIDGSDNFELRCLINESCVKYGIPWVYGAVQGYYGIQMNIIPEKTACLNCLIDQAPPLGSTPSCNQFGVFPPIVTIIGSIQVAEALKILIGAHNHVRRTLIAIDLWENHFSEINVMRLIENGGCRVCVRKEFDYLEGRKGGEITRVCGANQIQIKPTVGYNVNLEEIAKNLKGVDRIMVNPFLLRFAVGEFDVTLFPDGRALIKGTEDLTTARMILAKYLGM